MKVVFIILLLSLISVNMSNGASSVGEEGDVGAVYTMTNGASFNEVLISRMNSIGQLIFSGTIRTNGIGVKTTATDPLSSQGSMIVYSNYLFVVNPGSNSLSMFVINPSDATQITLVSVAPTNGWFPISVTVNGRYACVLTGGNETGIRCYTYSSSGLFIVPSFDRDLTSYISQTIPPTGVANTFSQIQFSADDQSLIISVKGASDRNRGYLLFYKLTNNGASLSLNPTLQTPPEGIYPFSMTLAGRNGLLITDPGARGVLTQTYSSVTGTISNSVLTPIDASIAGALCWSTYSPTIGNYYVIGLSPAAVVELRLDLTSTTNPVEIIRYYSLPRNTGALETTVVTLNGIDYLYVIGTTAQVINSYRLNAPGRASFNGVTVVRQRSISNLPKIAGLAAYVQISS